MSIITEDLEYCTFIYTALTSIKINKVSKEACCKVNFFFQTLPLPGVNLLGHCRLKPLHISIHLMNASISCNKQDHKPW